MAINASAWAIVCKRGAGCGSSGDELCRRGRFGSRGKLRPEGGFSANGRGVGGATGRELADALRNFLGDGQVDFEALSAAEEARADAREGVPGGVVRQPGEPAVGIVA